MVKLQCPAVAYGTGASRLDAADPARTARLGHGR